MESCGDRNQGEQTEKIIQNSRSVQGDTAMIPNITKPVISLIYNLTLIYNTDMTKKMQFITMIMNSFYFYLS